MKVIWARDAVVDLARIRSHIADDNPIAANRLAKRLLYIATLLAGQPKMGVATVVSDIRRLVVPQTVYSLIYRITTMRSKSSKCLMVAARCLERLLFAER